MSRVLRLSPCIIDSTIAYLCVGDASELLFLVEECHGALDHDLRGDARGRATSCHVFPSFRSTTAGEVHDLLEAAILSSGCDAVVTREPLTSAVPCGCGPHCAVDGTCALCLDAEAVETVKDLPACAECAAACRELAAADTVPPPEPEDYGPALDVVLAEAVQS